MKLKSAFVLALLGLIPSLHAAVVTNGLVGYYDFAGGVLTNRATAVGSTSANQLGAMTPLTFGTGANAVNTSSGAAVFDNVASATVGGYLKLAVPYGANTTAGTLGPNFSISVFYRTDSPLTGGRQAVFEGDTDYDVSYGLNNGTAGSGQVFSGNNTSFIVTSATTGASGVKAGYDNIILTYQSGVGTGGLNTQISAYFNGVFINSITSNTSASISDVGLVFGTFRSENGRFFDGDIDDIAIYDRVLTQTEINTIAVPEPTVALLSGLSALALLRRRRR